MTKPASIHELDGTLRPRHGDSAENEKANTALMPKGGPLMPAEVAEIPRAVEVWDQYIRLLPWLTEADSWAMGQYCLLCADLARCTQIEVGIMEEGIEVNAELLMKWNGFSTTKMAQMRKLESELGMTLISRGKFKADEPAGNSFFDD